MIIRPHRSEQTAYRFVVVAAFTRHLNGFEPIEEIKKSQLFLLTFVIEIEEQQAGV